MNDDQLKSEAVRVIDNCRQLISETCLASEIYAYERETILSLSTFIRETVEKQRCSRGFSIDDSSMVNKADGWVVYANNLRDLVIQNSELATKAVEETWAALRKVGFAPTGETETLDAMIELRQRLTGPKPEGTDDLILESEMIS